MTSNPSSPATREAGPAPALVPADILNGLEVGVLVVGADGVIRYRNERARGLLADACDLESAFAAARFLGPFEGWTVELSRVLTDGQRPRWEYTLPRPG